MAQKYGGMANTEEFDRTRACLVCDDPRPRFSWTDYSGEGYCLSCGTPYQLKWGTLEDGQTYPRINIDAEWVPILRRFWDETHAPNGAGTFMGFDDYPDQLDGRRRFNAWCRAHEDELPKKRSEEPEAVAAVVPGAGVLSE